MIHPFATPGEAWFAVVDSLLNLPADQGYRVSPRGQDTVELPGPTVVQVMDPTAIAIQADGRNLRHVIGVTEGLSLVGQTSVPEVIIDKVAAFRPFMTRSIFWGAYGPRVAGDVGNLVELLKRDPDSRQAVLTIFDSDRDLLRTDQADLPCTVALMFTIRDGQLDLWTVMRSNDAWLGLPYDLMQFGMLQAAIAQALGVGVGLMTHSANSMHLYERNRAKAMAVRSATAHSFAGPLWGGSGDISETSSRARRILLGQHDKLDQGSITPFEWWMIEILDDEIQPRPFTS